MLYFATADAARLVQVRGLDGDYPFYGKVETTPADAWQRLRSEAEQLRAGQEIHWYSRVCLDAAGNIEDRITEYSNGKFVWFASGASKLYGEAFLGQDALTALIAERNLPLELELFDSTSLAQDVFVLRRL